MYCLLDVDGCIANNTEEFIKLSQAWLIKHGMSGEIINPDGYNIKEVFGVDVDWEEVFTDIDFVDFYVASPMEYVAEATAYMKLKGHKIIILTSRNPSLKIPVTTKMRTMFNLSYAITELDLNWLTKAYLHYNDIPYESVVYEHDKAAYALSLDGDVIALDDAAYNLKAYKDAGVRCVAMAYPHNRDIDVERIIDWREFVNLLD